MAFAYGIWDTRGDLHAGEKAGRGVSRPHRGDRAKVKAGRRAARRAR